MKYTNYEVFCSVIFSSLYYYFFPVFIIWFHTLTLSILHAALKWPSSLKVTDPVLHSYKQWGKLYSFIWINASITQTWRHVTFPSSPNLKIPWNVNNLKMIKLNCNAATFRNPRKEYERSFSSGRTNGICAAKQVVHTSRRISPFKSMFSIVSFTVSLWILLHLASYTCTHTHTHT